MNPSRPVIALLVAIVCFVLAVVTAESVDGEVLVHALSWVALGLIGIAVALLPIP